MKCDTCLHHLDAYINHTIEQTIDESNRNAVEQHLRDCASCNDQHAELQLCQQLASLPAPTLSAHFVRNAFDEAAANQRRKQNRIPVFGLGGALAASLMIFMFAPLPPSSDDVTPTDNAYTHIASLAPHHLLPLNKQGNMKMVLRSDITEAATITLTLPDHVELKGFPEQHQISWQTTLKKGKNQLVLPLLAHYVARGELVAEIQTASDFEQFKFILDTTYDAEHSQNNIYNHRLG